MSGSDTALHKHYKNIERPYANVDLSKVPSWDIVMSIMEQQAFEARRQVMAKYHQAQSEQMMPHTVTNFDYQTSPYNGYSSQGNSTEESDSSSCCSEEMLSSAATSSQSDMSASDSDIEIDVDSIEEDSDDYFLNAQDNIPLTVLQFEAKLREKERNN